VSEVLSFIQKDKALKMEGNFFVVEGNTQKDKERGSPVCLCCHSAEQEASYTYLTFLLFSKTRNGRGTPVVARMFDLFNGRVIFKFSRVGKVFISSPVPIFYFHSVFLTLYFLQNLQRRF
jgi:hypothetical protein